MVVAVLVEYIELAVVLLELLILEVAVVGKKDAERGEIVKAFVVLKPGYVAGDALVQAIQQHVKTATAPYKYPREISFLPALPKNPAGKLLRRELRDRAA